MFKIIAGLLTEIWKLLVEMSPYLLFGFFIAGLLHVLIPREKIYRHFSGNTLSSILKASLFGVPLPLCSCGVIPVAAHLRKEGAGKGPTTSFLFSTPTTGVDSILATYALLGPLFAVIRPVSAFFGGIFAGAVTNLSEKKQKVTPSEAFSCAICDSSTPHSHDLIYKIKRMFNYAFFELIEDIGKWIIIGVFVGGAIGYFIPANMIEKYLGNPLLAYSLMLVIAVPLYVCATGSIPIAASLIMKGMTPGAGLVFLIAGPATNTATLSFVAGKLGKKNLLIYLSAIILTALLFGLIIDYVWQVSGKDMKLLAGGMKIIPLWLKTLSAVLLIGFILKAIFKKAEKEITGMGVVLKVPDMTCEHCRKTIDSAIRKLNGIKDVRINLKTKEVEIIGDIPEDLIVSAIKETGYSVEKFKK